MKRITVLCSIVLLLVPLTALAAVVLSVGSNTASPGSENIAIPITLDNTYDQVKGIQFEICEQPNYLTIKGCESTDRASSLSCLSNELENGCARIMLYSVGELITEGTGKIMTIYYDVSEEATRQCINLNPSQVKVSDEYTQPLNAESEGGTLCTSPFALPIIDIKPSQVWQSRWTLLPYLMTIVGQDISRDTFVDLNYYPSDAIFSFPPIVWSKNYIWSPIWVLPGFKGGMEEQTVTVSVLTEDGVLQHEFNILPIGFTFQPSFVSITPNQATQGDTLIVAIKCRNTTFMDASWIQVTFSPSDDLLIDSPSIVNDTEIRFGIEIDDDAEVGYRTVVVIYDDHFKKSIIGNNVFEVLEQGI